MAKEEPLNEPELDAVELLNLRLDKVFSDLRDVALELLSLDATVEEVDRAVVLAIQQLAVSHSNEPGDAVLNKDDSRLFEAINAAPDVARRNRWQQLVEKRDNGELSSAEQSELISIGQEMERLNFERLQAASELARNKGLPFEIVCEQLGISPI
jgi:hypothetical protein